MKNILKRMTILCMLATLVLTGCGTDGEPRTITEEDGGPAYLKFADDPITLDWYINYSWYTTPWGQNMVSKAITDETGVSINFIVPTGSESQKLDAMIASDTLPDLITLGWWETQAQIMVDEDMVYALNLLADEYDPYFYQVADEQIISWYRNDDGNLYCYPNSSFTTQDYEDGKSGGSNQNFLVRKDIYEAIGSPDMTTPEGFVEAVKKAYEMFPEVGGEPLIPIGADEFSTLGCNSFDKYLQNFLAVPFEENGVYYDRYLDPDFITWLKTFRELNELGYLSDEIFIDKRVQLEEKMAKGRYFCMLYQGSDIQSSQKILYSKDPNSIYIAVDGPKNSKGDDPVLPSTGINGWTITLISKNCENPERAIAFLSFLMSEEGQKMVYLGVEGEMYDIIDGEYIIRPEVQYVLDTNREVYDQVYGGDDAYWMLQDNVMQEQWVKETNTIETMLKEWTIPYTKYTGQYDVIFKADSVYSEIEKKIQEAWGATLPMLLLADSEEEFDQILSDYKTKKYALGYDELLEEYTRQMKLNKEKLGLEEE